MDFMTDSLLAGIGDLLAASVREDLGSGDVTSDALIPEDALARAEFVSKESLVVAGIPLVRELVRLYDPGLKFRAIASDGARVSPGSVLIEVEGRARAIFAVERISPEFPAAAFGDRDAYAPFRYRGRGDEGGDCGHPENDSGTPAAGQVRGAMRWRREPSHGAFRCGPDQEQSSGVSPRRGYGHRTGRESGPAR